MSYVRRDRMLDEMFADISTSEEKLIVQRLYENGHKGSAVVFMTKRIKRSWDSMLGKNQEVKSANLVRTITINEGGSSRKVIV